MPMGARFHFELRGRTVPEPSSLLLLAAFGPSSVLLHVRRRGVRYGSSQSWHTSDLTDAVLPRAMAADSKRSFTYESDVDGLRALAVLAVI